MIDFDRLSKDESKDWVFKEVYELEPDADRYLVKLSDGGKDAAVIREFDTAKKSFVTGSTMSGGECGFVLPEGKHWLAWKDRRPTTART